MAWAISLGRRLDKFLHPANNLPAVSSERSEVRGPARAELQMISITRILVKYREFKAERDRTKTKLV